MKKFPISALILAKNEAQMLPGCLQTLGWCQEILVLDDGSVDSTIAIAEKYGAKVINFSHPSFARKRMEVAKHAKTEWLLYLDPDERITPQLAQEIWTHLDTHTVLMMHRQNIFYGHSMTAGGWQHDTVTRIFPKAALQGWSGTIHESPEFTGQVAKLQNPLLHFSHRSIQEGLLKSTSWTKLEAQALFDAHISSVNTGTIIRKMLGELYRRLLKERGYKDGAVGSVEAIIQSLNRALVYLQVWELQQNPSIASRYSDQEHEIKMMWETAIANKKL